MPRLKSRAEFPPGGFKYIESYIPSWTSPSNASFNTVVQAVIDLRRGNRWLVSDKGRSLEFEAVANEVDEQNASRCIAHGWNDFVMEGVSTSPRNFPNPQRLQQAVAAVGSSTLRTIGGIKLILEWLGDGGKPVSRDLAETRAAVCVTCPKNGDPNFIEELSAMAAEGVRKKLEIKNEMQLMTSHDLKLHTCKACSCFLKLKIWTPLDVIRGETSDAVKKELVPQCWILKET